MDQCDLIRWAATHAQQHLSGLGDRWTHVRAVADRAEYVSEILDPGDRAYLVASAWLHDVGYAPDLATTGFHPLDGARHLRSLGQERVACLVAYHSSAWFEAAERGLGRELAEFEHEDSLVMDTLTYVDMTTGPRGQRLSLAQRVAEILHRYPPEDPVHTAMVRAHDALRSAVMRADQQLVTSGLSTDVGLGAALEVVGDPQPH